jgi:hypothetical protein
LQAAGLDYAGCHAMDVDTLMAQKRTKVGVDLHPALPVAKNRIIALQVSGPAANRGYSYDHVDLGATTATLVQVFGQPNHFEPSKGKGTEPWTYNPWPFSCEVRDGRISSIRISEPN